MLCKRTDLSCPLNAKTQFGSPPILAGKKKNLQSKAQTGEKKQGDSPIVGCPVGGSSRKLTTLE